MNIIRTFENQRHDEDTLAS